MSSNTCQCCTTTSSIHWTTSLIRPNPVPRSTSLIYPTLKQKYHHDNSLRTAYCLGKRVPHVSLDSFTLQCVDMRLGMNLYAEQLAPDWTRQGYCKELAPLTADLYLRDKLWFIHWTQQRQKSWGHRRPHPCQEYLGSALNQCRLKQMSVHTRFK